MFNVIGGNLNTVSRRREVIEIEKIFEELGIKSSSELENIKSKIFRIQSYEDRKELMTIIQNTFENEDNIVKNHSIILNEIDQIIRFYSDAITQKNYNLEMYAKIEYIVRNKVTDKNLNNYDLIKFNDTNIISEYENTLNILNNKVQILEEQIQNNNDHIQKTSDQLVSKIERNLFLEKQLSNKLVTTDLVSQLKNEIMNEKVTRRIKLISLLGTLILFGIIITYLFKWSNYFKVEFSLNNISAYIFLSLLLGLFSVIINLILKEYNHSNHLLNEKNNKLNTLEYYYKLSTVDAELIDEQLKNYSDQMLQEVLKPISSTWNKSDNINLSGVEKFVSKTIK